jgi:hypothetical protein
LFVLPDLRKHNCDAVIERVQRQLGTRFDLASAVRKRRSLGFRTDRNTWVRIEIRSLSRIDGQGWGIEEAAVLRGVAMPSWHQGLSWIDHQLGVMWRADETAFVSDPAIKLGGFLTVEPALSEAWWMTLNSSLDALAKHPTTRVATSAGGRITQERISVAIHQVFPDVDTTIDEWSTAHADFAWPNLTAPTCYFLDWEDWGLAPRGYDAATLRGESLAVPALAERVYQEWRPDLDSRSGQLSQLYYCAKVIAAGERSGSLLVPATELANQLVTTLRA